MDKVKYRLRRRLPEYSGFNIKFDIEQRPAFTGIHYIDQQWIGKISRALDPHIYDLNNRALLAYDLACFLEIPMPEIKLIAQSDITNFYKIYKKFSVLNSEPTSFYDYKNILICQHKGKPVTNANMSRINVVQLLKIFIFDCWIGSFDKGDDEFLIDKNNNLWTIDYQLWGTVGEQNMSLGHDAITYPADETSFNKCLGSITKKSLFSSSQVDFDLPVLNSIENFPDNEIRALVNKYKFFKRGSDIELLNEQMIAYLIQRKKVIRKQLTEYFKMNSANH